MTSILKGIRCDTRRHEGIVIDALDEGIRPHIGEDDVGASCEQTDVLKRSDVNGRPQYRDVYTGVGLHTRAVGAVRKYDLGFAASLDACEPRPHAAPQ